MPEKNNNVSISSRGNFKMLDFTAELPIKIILSCPMRIKTKKRMQEPEEWTVLWTLG